VFNTQFSNSFIKCGPGGGAIIGISVGFFNISYVDDEVFWGGLFNIIDIIIFSKEWLDLPILLLLGN
jgi:hypothetical protein